MINGQVDGCMRQRNGDSEDEYRRGSCDVESGGEDCI